MVGSQSNPPYVDGQYNISHIMYIFVQQDRIFEVSPI